MKTIIISHNPKLTIRRMLYESVVDLDMFKTDYDINEEGWQGLRQATI